MPAGAIYLILLQGGQYGHLWGPLGGRVLTDQHFDGIEPVNSQYGIAEQSTRGEAYAQTNGNPPAASTSGNGENLRVSGEPVIQVFGGMVE